MSAVMLGKGSVGDLLPGDVSAADKTIPDNCHLLGKFVVQSLGGTFLPSYEHAVGRPLEVSKLQF